MDYLPIFLDLRDRPVLLVGGGAVATRKAELLVEAGARVRVVAPSLSANLRAWRDSGRIAHVAQLFDPALLQDAAIVIAATEK